MYKCKHFEIHELVSPSLYLTHGEKAWKYLSAGTLTDLDTIRDRVKKLTGQSIIINNYNWRGSYSESGLRTPDCVHWNPLSGHSQGGSFDLKMSGWLKGDITYDLNWLQDVIRELKLEGELVSITEMELGTDTGNIPWCHIGSRNVSPVGDEVFYEYYG